MVQIVCATWSSRPKSKGVADIIPDGCQDLIMRQPKDLPPYWFVSPLFESTHSVNVIKDSQLVGFRFHPGAKIQSYELLQTIYKNSIHIDRVEELFDDFIKVDVLIDDVLSCLASDIKSVKQASNELGVSVRTLQRLVINRTGKTPKYWFQLARIRKAARAITTGGVSFSEAAYHYGFSDQPHMNREFKRWFAMSPSELCTSSSISQQLSEIAYS